MRQYKTQSKKLKSILDLGCLTDISNTLDFDDKKRNLKNDEKVYQFRYNLDNQNHDFISFEMKVNNLKKFINILYPLLLS